MSQTFESIQIDGAFIKEFTVVLSEEVRMILLRAPQNDNEEHVTVRSELKFSKPRACKVSFRAEPWLEITSHDSLAESEYEKQQGLQKRKSPESPTGAIGEECRVFRIICDDGEIAVLAESFVFTLVEKIPHFEWSEAK